MGGWRAFGRTLKCQEGGNASNEGQRQPPNHPSPSIPSQNNTEHEGENKTTLKPQPRSLERENARRQKNNLWSRYAPHLSMRSPLLPPPAHTLWESKRNRPLLAQATTPRTPEPEGQHTRDRRSRGTAGQNPDATQQSAPTGNTPPESTSSEPREPCGAAGPAGTAVVMAPSTLPSDAVSWLWHTSFQESGLTLAGRAQAPPSSQASQKRNLKKSE